MFISHVSLEFFILKASLQYYLKRYLQGIISASNFLLTRYIFYRPRDEIVLQFFIAHSVAGA